MAKRPAPVEPVVCQSLTQAIDAFASYAESNELLKCYRGQRNSAWDNIPGLWRPDLVELERHEKRAVRDIVSVHPQEFAGDQSMFDKLVRMQHFGLPTRLLDVTLNPLVALYFATEKDADEDKETDGVVTAFSVPPGREKYFDSDCVSCLANLSNLESAEKRAIVELRESRVKGTQKKAYRDIFNDDEIVKRLHQFIRVEKPYFLPIINYIDLFKPYYVHPKMSNRRIVAQAGAFIIYGLRGLGIKFAQKIEETRFLIPKEQKGSLRKALDNLGINESTLFPEIDRAAKRIKDRYAGA